MIRPETRRRARCFQLLSAWETQGRPPINQLVPGFGRLVRPSPIQLEDAAAMAEAIVARVEPLDALVARAAEHWRMERIGQPERIILRQATWELEQGSTPPKVVIDQALWLTRRFASPTAVPFINGVLDRIARELGRL